MIVAASGYTVGVTKPTPPASEPSATTASLDHRSDESSDPSVSRAQLLPEEQAVGSDDPQAQARAILADSEARVADDQAGITTGRSQYEARRSEDTV